MKIAVCGTQCVGKSTFINDFLKKWPMYVTPEVKCSDIVKGLNHSQESTENTQDLILNHLINQATSYSKQDNVILDRCVLDNLAYTSWLNLKGKVSNEYIQKVLPIVHQSLKLYDIIFYIPLTKVAPVSLEANGTRDVDPTFREEINNIFSVFAESYYKGTRKVFPTEDCPALIEIFGKPEERIKLVEFYINENGNIFSEDEPLIQIPAEFDPELKGII